jgi:DNA-binding NtrC family response regulator
MDDTRETMREDFKAGACDFLYKNADNETLLRAIGDFCAKYETDYRTIRADDFSSDERSAFIRQTGMIGCSKQLFELSQKIRRIAKSQATVLINGESGTGKELVARALHSQSLRANKPFVALNVAAVSATLLDSILFGHKRGAFTGAVADHPGKFKQADGGTLFLDEIGDLNSELQVKLLRVLQERSITPVGSTKDVPVDVRIVTATHKDLQALVDQGLFREDLLYRINTVTIETLPLRERPDDIEPLVAFFSDEICKQNGFEKSFNRRCLDVLRKQPWRGNVRELRSFVERHLIESDTREILPEHLSVLKGESTGTSEPITMQEIDEHVENVKREFIRKALNETDSKAEAARRLRVAPNRLHYFLEKLRLRNEA